MLKTLLISLLRFYQLFLSPLKGPTCRFIPTCSQYTCDAIKHFGVLQGLLKGTGRLLRCHPFHQGGYDPVIKNQCHQ
jgi:uncharacterized protein